MGNHCFSEHDNREDEDSKADSAGEPFVADYEKHTKINLQSFELLRVPSYMCIMQQKYLGLGRRSLRQSLPRRKERYQ